MIFVILCQTKCRRTLWQNSGSRIFPYSYSTSSSSSRSLEWFFLFFGYLWYVLPLQFVIQSSDILVDRVSDFEVFLVSKSIACNRYKTGFPGFIGGNDFS